MPLSGFAVDVLLVDIDVDTPGRPVSVLVVASGWREVLGFKQDEFLASLGLDVGAELGDEVADVLLLLLIGKIRRLVVGGAQGAMPRREEAVSVQDGRAAAVYLEDSLADYAHNNDDDAKRRGQGHVAWAMGLETDNIASGPGWALLVARRPVNMPAQRDAMDGDCLLQ